MAEIETLQELYVDELKDLWSANDQMAKALTKIAPKASNQKLKDMLAKSQEGIATHTETLKGLIEGQDEKLKKEHCKGMEGLAAEALKHTIEEPPKKGPLLDVAIVAQYQRMTHYGITGFSTVASLAEALKLTGDTKALKGAVKDMVRADDLMDAIAHDAIMSEAEA